MQVNVHDFGVFPTNTPEDNSAALFTMRDTLLAKQQDNPNEVFSITFPASTSPYRYDKNRWLWALLRVEMLAYGATLEYTGSGRAPFNVGNLWSEEEPNAPTDGNVAGSKTASIEAGDYTAALTEPSELARFYVGCRVFLYGYDQQHYGFPPNARFFEWNDVVAIDSVANTLTFTKPIRYRYSTEWFDRNDVAVPVGHPRVKNIDPLSGKYRYTEWLHIKGLTVKDEGSTGSPLFAHAKRFYLTDVTCHECWPGNNEAFVAERCKFTGEVQIDKMLDLCRFSRCEFNYAPFLGSGCNHVVFDDGCVIDSQNNRNIDISSRQLTVRDSTIIGGETTKYGVIGDSGWGSYRLNLRDNRIVNRSSELICIYSPSGKDLEILSDSRDGAIRLPKSGDPTFMRLPQFGQWFWNIETGRGGKILDQYEEGDDWVIKGDWLIWPMAGETWQWATVSEFNHSGNSVVGLNTEYMPIVRHPLRATPGKTEILRLSSNDLGSAKPDSSIALDIYGHVDDVRLTVHSPHAGNLVWGVNAGGGGFFEQTLDLATTGQRGLILPVGADQFDPSLLGVWAKTGFLKVNADTWSATIEIEATGAVR